MIALGTQRVFRSSFLFIVMTASVMGTPPRAQDEHITTLRGQVLNSVTKEPVAHALVTVMGERYAMFTDDQGRYEFRIHPEGGGLGGGSSGTIFVNRLVNARKPGFLDSARTASSVARPRSTQEIQADMTIYLVPEALIVGHVDVPGTEGEVRIECELYRKEMSNGRQKWTSSGTRGTWANGEFRFSSLQAGTYKLITHEEMDRDSMAQIPGAPLFGYPPVYYPNTTDFSAAGEIAVKAGETAQVNLTVARHAYYPVRISTGNAPAGTPIGIAVWPMGHWGPGWSLGYNPAEQTIEGLLPDGNYTVEAHSFGQQGSTGIANFSVKGRPVEGPGLMFVPNASVSVSVRQDFHADQAATDNGDAPSARIRVKGAPILHITLSSLDEYSEPQDAHARPVAGSQGREYTIPSVRPGRYEVNATIVGAYASAIESGGKDLMHEPLVVPLGGSVPPIEITLRDDGAEVDGTVNDASGGDGNSQQNQAMQTQTPRIIYLVPMGGGPPRMAGSHPNGSFSFTQVPPGDYRLLAFAEQQQDVENVSEPLPQEFQDKGHVVHVEAGQKANVTLDVIDGSAE